MVIEDDTDVREAMIAVLEAEGYPALGVANGREALERLERAEPPALILLDLRMPEMDGVQFRERQVEDPRLRLIPVAVFSAQDESIETAASLGVDCLQKPVDVKALFALVVRYCDAA